VARVLSTFPSSSSEGIALAAPVVMVEHLEKRYGETIAVQDVSFEVSAGEIFGILGPNGSGKTTTVECVQGLRRIDGGTVRVLGYDPAHQAGELRHHIGAQLQESALPDRMRVRLPHCRRHRDGVAARQRRTHRPAGGASVGSTRPRTPRR